MVSASTLRQNSLECVRISFEANFYRLLALVLAFQRIEALLAIAILTELATGKAVAIQFQALGFCAVAMLSTSISCERAIE